MKFDFNRYINLANPKIFSYHKQAETFEDYDDAYNFNPKRKRYAVADGVSNSIGAKLWAQLLVDKFCDSDVPSVVDDFRKSSGNAWLESIRLEWSNKMFPFQSENESVLRRVDGSTLPNHGAATFVGFEIREHQDGNLIWEALIIGDTCLFHLDRNNELISSYPLVESAQFTNQPKSFATLSQSNIDSQVTFLSPSLINHGDMFIIATDALAKWMLTQHELGNWLEMMQELDQISYQSEFYEFINKIRRSDKTPLEDDDVTLLFVPTKERPLARNFLSTQNVVPELSKPQYLPEDRHHSTLSHQPTAESIQKQSFPHQLSTSNSASMHTSRHNKQSRPFRYSKKWIPKFSLKMTFATAILLLIVLFQIVNLIINLCVFLEIRHG